MMDEYINVWNWGDGWVNLIDILVHGWLYSTTHVAITMVWHALLMGAIGPSLSETSSHVPWEKKFEVQTD